MATKKPIPSDLSELTPNDFRYSKNPGYEGNIYAGWKIIIDTPQYKNETHECYQFKTFPEIMEAAQYIILREGLKSLKLVTHSGGYKNMKTVFHWTPESKVGA